MKDNKTTIMKTFGKALPPKLPEIWVLVEASTGQMLQLNSKKKSWNRIGHAKTALLNHIEDTQVKYGWDHTRRLTSKECKELAHQLVEEGIINVVCLFKPK
jgi:hypothetical protein